MNPEPENPRWSLSRRLVEGGRDFLFWSDGFIPVDLLTDPEATRQAGLLVRFGFLGSLSGLGFLLFYAWIRHFWGVGIVGLCSVGFLVSPFLLRSGIRVSRVGNLLTGILWLGITALCFVEAGLAGHAIAWLVSVPLCALLLVDSRSAWCWTAASLGSALLLLGFALADIRLPRTYDARWETLVAAAGSLTLLLFLFLLGILFEQNRLKAQSKVQEALLRLESLNAQLHYLNEEKNEFLGIVAHDLKNPLTAILGNAELLAMTGDAADIPQTCEGIIKASSRMRNLITDLLDANAIEQGCAIGRIERCDLPALVEEFLGHNRDTAGRKDIRIHLERAQAFHVRADRSAMLQILDNLLSNAVKYSPPGAGIQVRMSVEQGHGLVAVIDHGPGLSLEDQKKLFRKYTRPSGKLTAGESSTGLSLSIVKRLAEAMSSTVECISVPGQGATFLVRLPLWKDPPVISPGPGKTG